MVSNMQKLGMLNGQKVCKIQKAAANFIQTQFQEGKTAAIIDGPWKAASLKEAKVNYGVATIPTLPNGKQYSAFGGGKAWVILQVRKP